MTAIIGIQGKGWAVLAADSVTTYSDRPYVAKGYEKISRIGDYLLAVAGDATAGDILNHLWQPPKPVKTQDPDKFVIVKILPSIRQILTEHGYDPNPANKKEDDDAGWDALICFNGKIYQLTDDYGFMRDEKGLYGIGSGGAVALGAIAAMENDLKTHTKTASAAKKAVNIAIQYNVWCAGPVNVKTQFTK
jgi:ATP-dependent protease HslVU (ClpYQ) peptidase subunit